MPNYYIRPNGGMWCLAAWLPALPSGILTYILRTEYIGTQMLELSDCTPYFVRTGQQGRAQDPVKSVRAGQVRTTYILHTAARDSPPSIMR